MSETRTYWLSFCDTERPTGQQFLGVAVVDVDEADMAPFQLFEILIPDLLADNAGGDGPWIAAAVRKAHQTGCNPGGEVTSMRLDEHPDFAVRGLRYPRSQLFSKAEIAELEA